MGPTEKALTDQTPSPHAPRAPESAPQATLATDTNSLTLPNVPQGQSLPTRTSEEALWSSLGVSDLPKALGPSLPLEHLARKHLELHPYESPHITDSSMLWYEGSFDPIGIHHFKIFHDTLQLGFKRAVFAMVYQNPYKKDSLPYEHRYEMARNVMEKAGLKVVDECSQEGVCIFPPSHDGLRRFHEARMAAIYGNKNFILVGPDNFEKAMTHNIIWTHIPEIRTSPHAQERYGFRSMYTDIAGFRDRVLVYPTLNSVHSTDIRKGATPMLSPVEEYVKLHKLYQVSPIAGHICPAPKTTTPPGPSSKAIHTSADIAEEISLQNRLLQRLQNGLTGLPLSMQTLKENFQPVLGGADRSQLQALSNVLTKCEDRLISKPRVEAQYFLDKRLALSTELLKELSNRLIGSHIEVRGTENLEAITKDHKAKIVFICNESGWGEIPVFTHALRLSRFGALAEAATFVFNRPQMFPTATVAATVGHGVTCIQPVSPIASRSTEEQKEAYRKTVKAGLERLSDGPVVLFPEQPAATLESFKLSKISPLAIEGLRNYVEGNLDPDFDAKKIYVVPVGIVGSECIDSAAPFSSENPAIISFGSPIEVASLIDTDHSLGPQGDEVVAHTLGFHIAELMPEEWQGVYGSSLERMRLSDVKSLAVNQDSFELARKLSAQSKSAVRWVAN